MMRSVLMLGLLAAAWAALVSWSEERPIETGSVVGQIKVTRAPTPPPLRVTTDADVCGTELASEAVLVGQGGALRNAVVSIEGVQGASAVRPRDLVLHNEGCAFRPHVQVGMVESPLTLSNHDPMMHNVHMSLVTGGRGRSILNLALPGRVPRLNASRATQAPGIVKVKCDAHEWMSAYILLFDHPFYAIVDGGGNFSIPRVPPGTYVVRVWHETLGQLTKEVTVVAGRPAEVSFTFGG